MLRITPAAGVAGATITLSGTVPPRVRHRVELQRKDSSGWKTLIEHQDERQGAIRLHHRAPPRS